MFQKLDKELVDEISKDVGIEEQVEFIRNLPMETKKLLLRYTFDLDKYINITTTGVNWKNWDLTDSRFEIAKEAIVAIDNIFKEIPKTTKELLVWRGAKTIYKSQYVSTSLSISIAQYCFVEKDDTLYKIIIPVGSSIIPLFPLSWKGDEWEILLDGKNGTLTPTGAKDCKAEIEMDNAIFDCTELEYKS
jgi:hypothetical protein